MTTRESFPYNPGLPDTSQKRRKGGRERSREKEARAELTESPERWNWGSSGGVRQILKRVFKLYRFLL